ncbi:MAG: hypothetical protein KHZ93_07445 [Clostridiales bacterium]|nr:hypothetical protein [Clostridiales bacterium]
MKKHSKKIEMRHFLAPSGQPEMTRKKLPAQKAFPHLVMRSIVREVLYPKAPLLFFTG